jgi:metal-responsive CopG/Arc/MetJ family transcriptional regulator
MTTKEKVTISLPKEVVNALREEIPPRKRSEFIAETIKIQLKKLKEQALIKAYKKAYSEIERENKEFDGVSGDGIS